MTTDALEIRNIHPLLRAYTVLVWSCFGVFMIGLAIRFPTTGHTFGFVLGAACLWAALYWWRVPDVRVTVRDDGLDYLDDSLGAFMRFRVRHAAWQDVTAVDTRPVVTRYGTFMRTRVTVRDGGAMRGRRRFTVTSRHDGYTRFLDALAAHTTGGMVETRGFGAQSALVRQEMRRILRGQFQVIAGLLLVAAVLVAYAALTRR